MRRGVTLVAAGITAFTLVVLVSVTYAVRAAASRQVPASLAGRPLNSPERTNSREPSQVQISPRDAANLAAAAMERGDAYSVELGEWNGVPAFKVTFSSGDVAYISLAGEFLGSVPVVQYLSAPGGGGGGGGQQRVKQNNDDREDEHEDSHEEHEGSSD